MTFDTRDTIAAIATAPGGAARAIVRLSGDEILTILERVFRAHDGVALSAITRASVVPGVVRPQAARVELPVDLYLWPHRRSYTRQPLAELHTLGSPPLAAALVDSLCRAGARLAAPGEFTLRAFLAGRIDLAQAEAVMSVVDARSKEQLAQSLEQLAGGLAGPLDAVRDDLLNLLADVEAGLDFAHEDLQFVDRDTLCARLDAGGKSLDAITARWHARGRHDTLPRAVLVGLPNVGKSSLFNALAPAGAALVSDTPGTTRDYLAATLELEGVRCQLIDTAGAEAASGPISQAAQTLGGKLAAHCELRLLCLDASRPLVAWEREQLRLNPESRQLVLLTKCDLPRRLAIAHGALATSVRTAEGLDAVRQAIARELVSIERAAADSAPVAERCLEGVRAARQSIFEAQQLARGDQGDELVAGELRLALAALGQVAGAVSTDELLDRVFSRFCIGK